MDCHQTLTLTVTAVLLIHQGLVLQSQNSIFKELEAQWTWSSQKLLLNRAHTSDRKARHTIFCYGVNWTAQSQSRRAHH